MTAACPEDAVLVAELRATVRELKRQVRQLNRQKELLEEDIEELAPDALEDMRHAVNYSGAHE